MSISNLYRELVRRKWMQVMEMNRQVMDSSQGKRRQAHIKVAKGNKRRM